MVSLILSRPFFLLFLILKITAVIEALVISEKTDSYVTLEKFRMKHFNTETLESIEKELQEFSNKESEEFLFATRKLIEQYTNRNLFILQIGLTSITPMIFNKLENISFIEENAEVCKKFFRNKLNKCWFYFENIEVYCKKTKPSIENNEKPTTEALNIIKSIYKKKDFHLIDILIVNHKYTVALLYYLFPFVDPSTLVVVMDQMNYKMKNAIFAYYNFIGETSFSQSARTTLLRENDTKTENDSTEQAYIEEKIKHLSLCVTTLKPQMIINPPENYYKHFIVDEYTVTAGNEISLLINDVHKFLKSHSDLYERNKLELSHYVAFICDFDMNLDNEDLKKEILTTLSSIITNSKNENVDVDELFTHTLSNLKSIFEKMLFHVYEHSEFKIYFLPLIDFLKFYVKKQDSYYVAFQFLLYELINESFGIASYELKEFLFLDILRELSKRIKSLPDAEATASLAKLITVLKKIKARENISYMKEMAKEFNVTYKDYEL